MSPKHLKQVPDDNDRKAKAPYNFVELPTKIVKAQELPDHSSYHPNRHTGYIKCTLTTQSPLYIRCGLIPSDFLAFGDKSNDKLAPDEQKKKANFFHYPALDPESAVIPVIPGSSLRGMLRTLVEIVSFSKISKVSDQVKFFFRAVAASTDDPLSELYKDTLQNVKAGYLVQDTQQWYIRPVRENINGTDLSYVWVKEEHIRGKIPNFESLNDSTYKPQYIKLSFNEVRNRSNKRFAERISSDPEQYKYQGELVTSGNMKENNTSGSSTRKNHCIVFEPDNTNYEKKSNSNNGDIPIDPDAIEQYKNALTVFQKADPFDDKMGVLKVGRPIFYCEPPQGENIKLFGQSPNFRIPYSINNDGKASSSVDFIPPELKVDTIDIAEAIFGFVREEDKKSSPNNDNSSRANHENNARSGRVFITDAQCITSNPADIWYENDPITPKILAGPKPTTFQHYLVQTDPNATKNELKHYGSEPEAETVIRGHKLYWHKRPDIKETDQQKISDSKSQYTQIKPIKEDVDFEFTIHFENLTEVELGALLWILSLSNANSGILKIGKPNDNYCLSLGMGKPLGMGKISIKYELYKSDRTSRYKSLFNDDSQWNLAESLVSIDKQQILVKAFEGYLLNSETGISECDHPEGERASSLNKIPRIEMLLAMLSCNFPPNGETKYMTIEPDEYEKRPVLPTPLQIKRVPDRRREVNCQSSAGSSSNSSRTNSSTRRPQNGGGNSAAWQRPRR